MDMPRELGSHLTYRGEAQGRADRESRGRPRSSERGRSPLSPSRFPPGNSSGFSRSPSRSRSVSPVPSGAARTGTGHLLGGKGERESFLAELAANEMTEEEAESHRSELESSAISHLECMVTQLVEDELGIPEDRREEWIRHIVSLSQQVVSTVTPDVREGDLLDIRPYTKLKLIPGGSSDECRYVDGVVFRKNVAHKSMARELSSPRTLLLSGGLGFQRGGNRISSFDTLLVQEERFTQILVDKVLALKPDLVLTGKAVSGDAMELLRGHGIVVIQHVKPQLLKRIARLVGVSIVDSIDHAGSAAAIVGTCGRFSSQTYPSVELEAMVSNLPGGDGDEGWLGSEWIPKKFRKMRGHGTTGYIFLEGCPKYLGCTLVLRGAELAQLKAVKRVVRFAIIVAYNLRLEVSYLIDRCVKFGPEAPPHFSSHNGSENQEQSESSGENGSTRRRSKPKRLLSSSLAVSFDEPEPPPPLFDAVEATAGSKRKASDAGMLCRTSPEEHQNLLMTSVWMTQCHQCCPAEVKGISYYTTQDLSLGQFLLTSCFKADLKCQSPACKRSARDHTLSFIHDQGRVSITVKRLAHCLPTSLHDAALSAGDAPRKQ
ncbi:unnamed protein product, partial [Chrysoparadoxa australica]